MCTESYSVMRGWYTNWFWMLHADTLFQGRFRSLEVYMLNIFSERLCSSGPDFTPSVFPSFGCIWSDVTISRFNLNNFISSCLTMDFRQSLHLLPNANSPLSLAQPHINSMHNMENNVGSRTPPAAFAALAARREKKPNSENCHGLSRNVSHWIVDLPQLSEAIITI